jgi:hypothetical protein
MQYILLFYGNNGYVNAPQYYVIRTYIVPLVESTAATFADSGYFRQLLHSFQLLIQYLPYHSTLIYTFRAKRRRTNQNK